MIRRELTVGLAAGAVSALAVTGLVMVPVGSANAVGEGVLLISPFNAGGDVSTRQDADGFPVSNPGVELAARRLDAAATITFEYNTDPAAGPATGGWSAIAGATLLGDYSSVDWTPPAGVVGTSIALRAVATGGASGTTYSIRNHVAVTSTAHAVTIAATEVGFFTQPYADSGRTATHASVPGTTSAIDGTVEVSWWDPASTSFKGKVAAQVRETEFKALPLDVPGGEFSADVDLTAFGADDGDIIAFGGERETDDLEPVTLDAQVINNIQATSAAVPAGRPAEVRLTVLDTLTRAVAGAEVRRADGTLVGYTDGEGAVTAIQAGGSSADYYVNATDANPFNAADGDKTVTHSAPTYAQVATTATAVSSDGPVFDDDEYAAGDLYIRVDDQQGAYMDAGTDVSYRVYRTGTTPPAVYATAATDAQGRVPISFAPSGPDGSYTVDYEITGDADPDQTFTFTAGDGSLVVAPAAGAASPGGQIAYTGTLKVGTQPLVGRRIGLDYTRGLELVPGLAPDSGFGTGRTLSVVVTTDATGAFSFLVDDAAESPQGAETGGKIAAATLAPSGGGSGTLTGNAAESAQGTAQFGSTKGKVKIKLKGKDAGDTKDKLTVKAPTSVSGETVKVYRVVNGKLELVSTKQLDSKGDLRITVPDKNAGGTTTYLVKLQASERVKKAKSKKVPLE